MRFSNLDHETQRRALIAHALLALRNKLGAAEFSSRALSIILIGASVLLVEMDIYIAKLFPYEHSGPSLRGSADVLEHFASLGLIEEVRGKYIFHMRAVDELYDIARPADANPDDLVRLQTLFTDLVSGWESQKIPTVAVAA